MMSKSNTATDVIRKTREIAAVRERLIASELSVAEKGWVNTSQEAMLDRFKERATSNGDI
ncbi:hypothetical protein [Thalassolituus sp.]|jgi:hypothetical protein|uniref:hypothetical protein n=1 Tax=Thalassolituus sp. TaxID=2030822 RepID=UPI002A80400F|nr:hypothetical protein [Thalassolituus sp.]|tara:strand:- start:1247 stop:1426 length:180 start_codon:yes stop_codon:yes gene_type:complete